MAEIIRHISGMCGEHFHPNIWHLLLGGVGISTIFSYIVIYIKYSCEIINNVVFLKN